MTLTVGDGVTLPVGDGVVLPVGEPLLLGVALFVGVTVLLGVTLHVGVPLIEAEFDGLCEDDEEMDGLNVGLALFEVVVVRLPLTLTEGEVYAVDDHAGDLVNNGDGLFVEVVEID